MGGMITMLYVESMNTCLKRLIYNLNTSLCELATEIHKLLNIQDKENEYKFWKLAIPMVKHQEKVNFLFSKVDQYIQWFLTPMMLKIQQDKINQSVYYVANKVAYENMESLDDDDLQFSSQEYSANDLQAMLKQMIEFVGLDDIEDENGMEELFLVANKFYQETQNQLSCSFSVQYLSILGKDLMEENLTVLEQKVTYRKIYGTYKKALCKEFVDDSDESNLEDQESVTDADDSDKENDKIDNSIAFCIKNPKVHCGKGRQQVVNVSNQHRSKKYQNEPTSIQKIWRTWSLSKGL
ncbi:8387_t:CDS:2 [Scutellospora calospora]|uniref:8387_t:CDS:1 n=1 Tax=Scutellospora calospora TaxID=85575 RepID=A0ACA9KW86_9GLOM|nr:8387_t:CDS:2 [Scutellospora calospora]